MITHLQDYLCTLFFEMVFHFPIKSLFYLSALRKNFINTAGKTKQNLIVKKI